MPTWGVLTQAIDSLEDLRPIVYTSGSFSDMQQRWSATEKEALAVYQSVLKSDLYLTGEECIFCCNHKPFEPFLSKGIKIPKLNRLSLKLAEYNMTFLHINDRKIILADAISSLQTLDIYKDPF